MNTRQNFALLAALLLQPFTTEAFAPAQKSLVGHKYAQHSPFSRISELYAVAKSGGKMIETDDQYNSVVLESNSPRPVLVFFSAPWCGPCRLTNPVVKEVMKQYAGDIDVVEVCTDDLAEVAEDAGITSIPTIQFYYGGKTLETIVGCVAKGVLANAVDKVLEDVQLLQQQKAP
mmetsp:Transcript_108110/g.161723  ORF Transcript_108110/g.161723 Transcript_108110/m.161723 type:complete len:174 (-) Transcript_108110:41-562(-)